MEESYGLGNHAGNLLAWLAGFIDADGMVCFHKQPKKKQEITWVPGTSITTTCTKTADFISRSFKELGLPVYRCLRKVTNQNWTDRHHMEIRGQKRVKRLLEAILPYLVTKREEAELVMEFIRLRQEGSPTRPYSEYEMGLVSKTKKIKRSRHK